ncbi:hypothetical protein VNO77_06651 [Canavalia gladiata]|uniref:Uncharacterized protein n=1 Tax=Canavalia gladiata TaxID=3824 RepID=A0AAN9M7N9_CANGL
MMTKPKVFPPLFVSASFSSSLSRLCSQRRRFETHPFTSLFLFPQIINADFITNFSASKQFATIGSQCFAGNRNCFGK